ncbi:methylenetetrahydrofolate reductase [Pseudonocardia alni]|uniref:Methylenetetrahydrofolate reductase n=1 Tax=Pseudonocardia alni TaxID=33907 RepID=A0A852W7S0_PSEA5|nr:MULTISPECIES: methylenetetrahydrofolate reductase [Pseudonocardia]MYW75000.1 5,10-methylenetetrahydrofolate reductase [Pseudonocardia sp. SID8383]NYG04610.1 methylenetetrahydrofolate reductase (NADPH) [Pseudonocardia antarctica]OJG08132.1 5,10-methylenetetrahydrofolate reductase [Pseudonocardia autotrophica]PKB29877.1 5,10-methylenetetrahydrofolate reductase (NAD(P)) [Pseudonocardia alni]
MTTTFASTVTERINVDRPFFAVEFFPPKDDRGEAELWRAIRRLEVLDPAYVSVTYGAGGSSRDRTVRTVERIATDTTLCSMAHLTAVSHSTDELRHVIGSLAAAGVRNIMALRGDPPGDPLGEWVAHPDGLEYADQLVALIKRSGPFCVGVAAFPYGHPRSAELETDTERLVGKFRAGAEFAVTQLFLEPDGFLRLRDRVAAAGFDQPIIPGIMPLTSEKTFHKGPELSGSPLPAALVERLAPYSGDTAAFRAAGMEVTGELCERLLAEGVPGIHFYCLNRSTATTELVERLGLAPRHEGTRLSTPA